MLEIEVIVDGIADVDRCLTSLRLLNLLLHALQIIGGDRWSKI